MAYTVSKPPFGAGHGTKDENCLGSVDHCPPVVAGMGPLSTWRCPETLADASYSAAEVDLLTGLPCWQEVAVSPDVDFAALAQLAEGYSGDDISGVCRDSAMASMRRKIAGKTPAEIR